MTKIKTKKKCPRCSKIKSFSDFYHDKRLSHGCSCYCKQCSNDKANEYYQKNKKELSKKSLETSLKRYYGISIDDYNQMFNKQQGCCAICGIHQSKIQRKLQVDHNHITKEIRGLLCHKCNVGIGFLCADNGTDLLKQSIRYLEIENNG